MNYKMVALIPARGGSERIPRKNIKLMAGKPMIAWTIEACLKSKYISRTFVSTEDKEIKDISIQFGAEVIDRPEKYALDSLGYELIGTIQQLREVLIDNGNYSDYLAFLYPTSPLRTSRMIDEAFELMISLGCGRCYSAYKLPQGIFDECWVIDENGRAKHRFEIPNYQLDLRYQGKNWQEDRYVHTADINIQRLREATPFTDTNYSDVALYVIDEKEVVDVNTKQEFDMCNFLLKQRIDK